MSNGISNNSRPKKIAIIGSGRIGMRLLEELGERNAADHISVWQYTAKGKAKEAEQKEYMGRRKAINQANLAHGIAHDGHGSTSQFDFPKDVEGDDLKSMEMTMKGADIIIFASGVPRDKNNPKQTRDDLTEANRPFIEMCAKAAHVAPHATFINITNAADTLAEHFQKKSGIPANQVVAMTGELDRTRLVESIETHLHVAPQNIISSDVIGQHGPHMIPLLSGVKIRQPDGAMKPLKDCCDTDTLRKINDETVDGGRIMTDLLGSSDSVAPAAVLTEMITQIINAKYRGIPARPMNCSAWGDDLGVYIGRPVQFGSDGKYTLRQLPEFSFEEEARWRKAITKSKETLAKLPGNSDIPLNG